MAIPEEISKHSPKGFGAVEIHHNDSGYYVYSIKSVWDPDKQRPKKVTGPCIGKITPYDGFIPNKKGVKLIRANEPEPSEHAVVKNYGTYEMLRSLSPDLEERLKEYFPDIFREIRTVALLRLVDKVSSAKAVRPAFLSSYLSELSPDLSLSDMTVRTFVESLGKMQNRLDDFMKSYVMPGTTLLFDGTTIFSSSADSLSERGYNPRHSYRPQTKLLYLFERDSQRPVFYRVLQGSVVDKSAFIDVVRDSGCTDCIVIADKGFYSKTNVSALMGAGMKFILPLNDNTKYVSKEFYADPNEHKFDDVFSYHDRPIWCIKTKSGDKGNFIYTFKDDMRMSEMRSRFIERAQKGYDEEEHKPMDVANEKRMGYFSFCSNLDVSPQALYEEYKHRWDIESCFEYLKDSVTPSAAYAHTDDYFRGWTFINHISMLYYYGLINALRSTDEIKGKSPEDIISLTKNIYMVDSGSGFRVSHIQEETQKILDALGIDLSRKI